MPGDSSVPLGFSCSHSVAFSRWVVLSGLAWGTSTAAHSLGWQLVVGQQIGAEQGQLAGALESFLPWSLDGATSASFWPGSKDPGSLRQSYRAALSTESS